MLAIRCRALTKRYGDRAVVDDLDLDVEEGEIFGFLGPNGAGKTTTARMLLGLIRVDSGDAWLLGSKVPCPARLGEIGAMIEEPAFYPWMTGRRNLKVLAAEGPSISSAAVDDALEITSITEAGDRKVRTYSQGMRQRLGLAAAVLRRPKLVLLDEPANGLDPAGIHDLRLLLRRLADEGTAVFLSSHLLGEVEQICDRVGVIDRGRLIRVGGLDSLSGRHRTRVAVAASETDTATSVLSSWEVTTPAPGELHVATDDARAVNEALAQAGIYAATITPERLSLENWFLATTKGDHHGAPTPR
jgi:ABC-type multidrug transport system ATPase subunit